MNILVACEESQAVTKELRRLGHEAYSCDIIECSGGHPEWHILCDVLRILDGGAFNTMDGESKFVAWWDLMIAHPPCTYLSNAGAVRLYKRIGEKRYIDADRLNKGLEGKEFFMSLWSSKIPLIAIENPNPFYCVWFAGIQSNYTTT